MVKRGPTALVGPLSGISDPRCRRGVRCQWGWTEYGRAIKQWTHEHSRALTRGQTHAPMGAGRAAKAVVNAERVAVAENATIASRT